jgi:hypothetical protein
VTLIGRWFDSPYAEWISHHEWCKAVGGQAACDCGLMKVPAPAEGLDVECPDCGVSFAAECHLVAPACQNCIGIGWWYSGPYDAPEQVQCEPCGGTGVTEDFTIRTVTTPDGQVYRAEPAEGLDVERLARAIRAAGVKPLGWAAERAADIAREYAALEAQPDRSQLDVTRIPPEPLT